MKKTKIVKSALDFIYQDSSIHITAEEVNELIKYINRLRNMSIDNAILVKVQKPDCKFAETYRNWMIYLGRELKPEAKPLIVSNGETVDFAYDISDTKGRKYDINWNPPKCEEEILYDHIKTIILNMKSIGIDFNKQILESKSAGRIEAVDEGMAIELTYEGKEYLVKKTHIILVNDTLSEREIFVTIVHELGHYFCGHIGNDEHSDFYVHFFKDEHLTHEQEEFEAECVSHIVCNRKSIAYDTKKYLWTYLNENEKISKRSIERILNATVEVEKMLYREHKPINGYINTSHIEGVIFPHKSFLTKLNERRSKSIIHK